MIDVSITKHSLLIKNNMLKRFDEICLKNKEKLCFVDKRNEASFECVHNDVLKMISLFKKKGIEEYETAVIFVLPSYEFYILLIAGVYYHLNMVVIDSFKDRNRTKDMLNKANPKTIFCTNKTRMLSFLLPNSKNFTNVSNFRKEKVEPFEYVDNKESIVLTTFTSGTTGQAKKIERNLADLERQMNLVKSNMTINPNENVLGTLPIYVLFSLINGYTTIISKTIDEKLIRKYKVNTLLTSIHNLLNVKKPVNNIENIYCGGAILYPREADYLKTFFPNAKITYVYGASEGVLIAKTTLDKYITNGYLTFDEFIDGMNVNINDDNEIIITGECVLNEKHEHATGDLGILKENKLQIVGRKKYSTNEYFNYIEDAKILNENPKVKKAFTLVLNNQKFLVFEGTLSKKYPEYKVFKFHKLPMDLKHKTKLDYSKVIKKLK